MKKADRMEVFIEKLPDPADGPALLERNPAPSWPRPYQGYFWCFNRGQFYEAHDVLEHLWLRTKGTEAGYYKGLIQVAGAFVHLRKHYLRPWHHKDGKRLAPAVRLFRLALQQFAPYPSPFLGLDLESVRGLCRDMIHRIEDSGGTHNPWRPETSPFLHPEPPALPDGKVRP